jgi:pimeloyl-ACP methyl ester carboxylesterase
MADDIERHTSNGISYLASGLSRRERPLVLVHGIGSNASSFTPLMRRLGGTRPLIAWDAPGYGGSEPLASDWPLAGDYANALAGLLDRLGMTKVDLVGHSLGALMAGRLAMSMPDRVGRLVLASPALGYGTQPGEPLAPSAGNRLDAFIAEGGERFAATRGPRLVHSRHNAALISGVVKAMSEVKLPGYAQACRMLSCGDLIADSKRLAMQTLVLVGAEDEVTPPANCRRLFDAMTAARPDLGHRWQTIADAGHAVPQERPDAVADAIAAFAPPGLEVA